MGRRSTYSRRDLFRLFGRRVSDAAGRARRVAAPPPGLATLRPPGFRDEGTEACLECTACADACPRDAIFPRTRGASPDHTPLIDPAKAPCVLCDDLPCISACPSSVLQPVARLEVRMATAEILEDLCRHTSGRACLECYHACPLPGVAITADPSRSGPRPRVLPEGCTGCGNCLYRCPERPRAIRMLPVATPRPPTPESSG